MVDDQLAQDKFRKSLKLRKLAWGTGLAWVGMVAYIASQEEIKDNSWGDYDAGQKAVFAGFVATSAAFVGSLLGEHFVRAGSFARICFPCEAKELGHVNTMQEYISLYYSGTGINMSYHF